MRDDAKAKIRSELQCHECGRWVQFELDMSLEGNHVLNCPVCGHEHCRVVRRGRITDVRWSNRNRTYQASVYSYSNTSNTSWTTSTTTSANFGYYDTTGYTTTSY